MWSTVGPQGKRQMASFVRCESWDRAVEVPGHECFTLCSFLCANFFICSTYQTDKTTERHQMLLVEMLVLLVVPC